MNSLKFLNLYSKAGLEEILLRDMSWGLIYILKRVKKGNFKLFRKAVNG